MSEMLTEKLTKTKEGMRLYQQERAILEVTELVCKLMDESDVNRAELARRTGTTKSYITQLLDGSTNMTVRTMSDVFTALDRTIRFDDGPLTAVATEGIMMSLCVDEGWSKSRSAWTVTVDNPRKLCSTEDRLAG